MRVTKSQQIGALLLRPEGATVAEIKEAIGWPSVWVQGHAKKNGLRLEVIRQPGRPKRYRGYRPEAPQIIDKEGTASEAEGTNDVTNVVSLNLTKSPDPTAKALYDLFKKEQRAQAAWNSAYHRLTQALVKQMEDVGKTQFLKWIVDENLASWVLHHLRDSSGQATRSQRRPAEDSLAARRDNGEGRQEYRSLERCPLRRGSQSEREVLSKPPAGDPWGARLPRCVQPLSDLCLVAARTSLKILNSTTASWHHKASHQAALTHPRKPHLLPLVERLVEVHERGADRGGGRAHGGKALAHRVHAADRGERALGGGGAPARGGGPQRGGGGGGSGDVGGEAGLLGVVERAVERRQRRLHLVERRKRGVDPLLHRLEPRRRRRGHVPRAVGGEALRRRLGALAQAFERSALGLVSADDLRDGVERPVLELGALLAPAPHDLLAHGGERTTAAGAHHGIATRGLAPARPILAIAAAPPVIAIAATAPLVIAGAPAIVALAGAVFAAIPGESLPAILPAVLSLILGLAAAPPLVEAPAAPAIAALAPAIVPAILHAVSCAILVLILGLILSLVLLLTLSLILPAALPAVLSLTLSVARAPPVVARGDAFA